MTIDDNSFLRGFQSCQFSVRGKFGPLRPAQKLVMVNEDFRVKAGSTFPIFFFFFFLDTFDRGKPFTHPFCPSLGGLSPLFVGTLFATGRSGL